MKIKYFLTVMLGLLTLAFAYRSSLDVTKENASSENIIKVNPYVTTPVNNNISPDFLIGAMTGGWQTNYSKLKDTLGFNLWHRYISGGDAGSGNFYLHGWTASDEYDADILDYRADIRDILDDNEERDG